MTKEELQAHLERVKRAKAFEGQEDYDPHKISMLVNLSTEDISVTHGGKPYTIKALSEEPIQNYLVALFLRHQEGVELKSNLPEVVNVAEPEVVEVASEVTKPKAKKKKAPSKKK